MRDKILDKIWKFLTCNQEGDFQKEEIRKAITLHLFTFVGDIWVLGIGISAFLRGNYTYAFFMLIYFAIINLSLWNFHRTKNYLLSAIIIVTTVFVVMTILLLNGKNIEGTGILWNYMFPLLVFFLLGRKLGAIYLIISFFTFVYFFIFPTETMFSYTLFFKQRFLMTWVCTAAFAYVFETVRRRTYDSFIESQRQQNMYLAEILQQKEEIQSQTELLLAVNNELQTEKQVIKYQNDNIKASIRYAQLIQQAILPEKAIFDKYFESFLIFPPKDIVSGDFYWFSETTDLTEKNYIFVAVVDCTGHGVPGAFMSVIGSRLLSEIVRERKICQPSEILNILDKEIHLILRSESTEIHDGMDLVLCRFCEIENNGYEVLFSGSKSPLFVYFNENQTITTFKADRKSIGGNSKYNPLTSFSDQKFSVFPNDILFFASDGIIDQNNKERKRFGTQLFLSTLQKNIHFSMSEQKIALENLLTEFQGNEEQRDDITVLGVKI